MMMRAMRWLVAGLIASAMTSVGCSREPARDHAVRTSAVVADASVAHAFDTDVQSRLIDRLHLDNFLRDRDIHVRVVEGSVNLTGEVWTSLERERAAALVRSVPGVVDVTNGLHVRPPGY